MSIAVAAPQRILMAEAQLLSPERSSKRGISIVGREMQNWSSEEQEGA